MLRAWRGRSSLRDASSRKSWLAAILRNEAYRYYSRPRPDPTDLVEVYGGREDELVLSTVDRFFLREALEGLSERERVLLALQAPFTVQSREIRISASIGIAIDADRTIDAEVLLRNADMAMYLAKDRGKNRFEVFEEGMHATVFERLELKADLARAITSGQLALVYQPVVALETGRITGAEALVRWDHPRRGRLSPPRRRTREPPCLRPTAPARQRSRPRTRPPRNSPGRSAS